MTPATDSTGQGPFPAEDSYFLEIESHFAARRGTPFVFSAKDWALMKSWRDQGIPLPVVIEAIDACFDKREQSPRKRVISSLSYCRHAVVELWDERKDLQVGGRGVVPEGESGSELETLVHDLDACAEVCPIESARALIGEAAIRVGAIRRHESVPSIESELMAIEEELLERLEAVLPAAERDAIHAAIDDEIVKFRFSDESVRERTRRASFRRRLRELAGLPRLSLFR